MEVGATLLGAGPRRRNSVKKLAADMAREWIEKHVGEVLKTYRDLAGGRKVKVRDPKTGRLRTERLVDPPTLRHWIDKLVPDAKQELSIEHKGRITQQVIIETVDPYGVRSKKKEPE